VRRPKLSRLAQRLRYALLQNPAITELPRCPRCAMLVKPADWSKRQDCCQMCEHDADPTNWTERENEMPWLPEEDEK